MTWKEKMQLNPTPVIAACDCEPEDVGYDGSRIKVLNQHIQSMIDRKMILSGSYCLARHGKVFADAALGNIACPWQGREHFMPDTFFELQSVEKMMTAVAILKLAEDGMLHLEQPVYEWIDEFRAEGFNEITILHLLTHTSGLVALEGVHEGEDTDWMSRIDSEHVKETWISAIVEMGLRKAPGMEWSYSMAGFVVLGEIIGRASGMRAEDFIRQTILLPCEMTESHWKKEVTDDFAKRYNIATKQDREDVRRYDIEGYKAFCHYAVTDWEELPETAGGLMSTARELVQFGEMLRNGGTYHENRIIGRKAVEYMWTNLVGRELRDHCWNHPGNRIVHGAGAPILRREADQKQLVSENVLYHEGHGACVLMIDREEEFVAVYRTQFVNEEEWFAEAVKGTASVIWSGL